MLRSALSTVADLAHVHVDFFLKILEPCLHSDCAELSANAEGLRRSQLEHDVEKLVGTQPRCPPSLLAKSSCDHITKGFI